MKLSNILKTVLFILLLLQGSTRSLFAKDNNILAYIDRGIKYYPKYVRKGLVKIGKASWYGRPFHRRLTASGERYNMYAMTAAHRTYAMNTVLKVTNLDNRRSVRVRVNDRGPFYSSRDIDLSYGAAKKLGMTQKGIGRVKIEVVSRHKRFKRTKRRIKKSKRTYRKHLKISQKKVVHKRTAKKTSPKKASLQKSLLKKTYQVQLGSFSNYKNAKIFKKTLRFKDLKIVKNYMPKLKKNVYRVLIPFNSEQKAQKFIKKQSIKGAFLQS